MIRTLALLAVVVVGARASRHAMAATLPSGFQESIVFAGLTQPTAMRFAADGRVFVAEKSGIVKVFDNLTDTTPTTFADLRTNVYNFWDRGLLGLALHPNFPQTPYVYVLYTADAEIGATPPRWGSFGGTSDGCPNPPGATADGCVASGRLSRLQAMGNQMTGSEQVLIHNWCQQFPSHSMGSLVFGADGALYVSAGEGGSFNVADYGQFGYPQKNICRDPPAGLGGSEQPATSQGGALRSQNVGVAGYGQATYGGKILRIDPATGAAMPDNPMAGSTVAGASRIVARGLRNPFRMTLRPGTNELWIGDVGWVSYEEIDRVVDPKASVVNFGWPCYEGSPKQSVWSGLGSGVCNTLYATAGAVVGPYFQYGRDEKVVAGDSCLTVESSITGLAFYAGGTYPASYDDALFFADYSRQCIWTMFAGADGLPDPSTRATFVEGAAAPVDLEIGPGGDLFYVDLDGGTVRRIRSFSTNQPPVAVATADRTSGPLPLTVRFDGTQSTDAEDGEPSGYAWDLDGDGAFDDAFTATVTFTYTVAGTYTVRLRVTDSDGATGVASIVVQPGNSAPTARITAPPAGTQWRVGDVIAFTGSATDPEQGTLPASALAWVVTLFHCPGGNCHSHSLQSFAGVSSGGFSAPDHEYPSYLELRLTATDAGGLTGTTTVRLDPRTVNLGFDSTPRGLMLGVGATSDVTPFARTVIQGSAVSLTAPAPQTLGGTSYDFVSWSDAGAKTHIVTAPTAPASYSATYVAGSVLDLRPDPAAGLDNFLTAPGNPNNNWSTLSRLWIGYDERNSQRPLLRFSLSPIPPSSTVTSCTLTVSADVVESPGAGTIARVTQPGWTESGSTWNRYDGVASWATPGGDADPSGMAVFSPPAAAGFYAFPSVTSLCQDAVTNRGGRLDLLLRQYPEAPGTPRREWSFVSSDDPDATRRPRLVVAYRTGGVATTSSTTVPSTSTTRPSTTTTSTTRPSTTSTTTSRPSTTATTGTLPATTTTTLVLVVQPDAAGGIDNYLTSPGHPNNNWGAGTRLWVGYDEVNAQRPLLRLSLSAITSGRVVTSCTLTVWADLVESPGSARIARVTQPGWTETGSSWNRASATLLWTTPGGDYDAAGAIPFTPPASSGAFVFPDLRALCQDAVTNRAGQLDVLLRQDLETPATSHKQWSFFASDYTDATRRPRLVVGYR
jgi:glucose/arabinose dehydrogenase/PKD repeat protein